MRKAVTVGLGLAAVVFASRDAKAQGGIRGVLNRAAEAARQAKGPSRFTVQSATVSGVDRVTPALGTPDGITRRQTPCSPGPNGVRRACFTGAGLRVVRVTMPVDTLPARAEVPVTVEVQNLAAAPSVETDVDLCLLNPDYGDQPDGTCRDRRDAVRLPSLGPGERATVVHRIRLGDKTGSGFQVLAVAGPGNRRPTTGVSRPFALELPALQFVRAETQNEPRCGGRANILMTIRNVSSAASSIPTEFQFGGTGAGEGFLVNQASTEWQGSPASRISVPALGPGQRMDLAVVIDSGTRCAGGGDGTLYVRVDPEGRGAWGPTHETSKDWPLRVTP